MSDASVTSRPRIEPTENGPYLVEGLASLSNSKGERIETKGKVWLCRCGRSKNKPFCDGTHWEGFKDEKN